MNLVYLILEPHVRLLTPNNQQGNHVGHRTDQTSCMKISVPLPSRLSTFQSYLSSCRSTPQWGHRVTGSGKANSDICTFLWTGGSADTAGVKEKAPSNDPEMPVCTEADSCSFLQALLHWPTHLTATPPLPSSSQAYFVFLTVDHVPLLRATVISQRR